MTREQLRTLAGFPGVIPGPSVEPSYPASTFTLTAMLGGYPPSGEEAAGVATIGSGCVVSSLLWYSGVTESMTVYAGATSSDLYFPGAEASKGFC